MGGARVNILGVLDIIPPSLNLHLCRLFLGRHPCLEKRFAKLEIKIIVAMFLTHYDYRLVDGVGGSMEELPVPGSNIS